MKEKKDFAEFLSDIDNGKFILELGDTLPDLIKRCIATGKKGAISITLKVAPRGGANVDVTPAFKVTSPAPAVNPQVFFTDEEGNPSLYQSVSPSAQVTLREVPVNPAGPLRVVGEKKKEGN